MSSHPAPQARNVYTDVERLQALAIVAETGGNTSEASRVTGIPQSTIVYWTQTEDGMEAIASLRIALRQQVAWKYAEIVAKSLSLLNDRLDYGDEHVTKDGRIIKRAVPARDLMMIAAVSQDKNMALTGSLEGSREVDRALDKLAAKLLDKMTARKAKANIIKDITPPADGGGFMG